MELLIFVILAIVIFGAKGKEWGDKKWEDRKKPDLIMPDPWLESRFCDEEYEKELRKKYPYDGEVTEERLSLVEDVARDILLSGLSRFTEQDLEYQTKLLAKRYLVEIMMVKRNKIPHIWLSNTWHIDPCGALTLCWGFLQLYPFCKELRVVEVKNNALWILPPDLKYTADTYYNCPRESFIARAKNTTW